MRPETSDHLLRPRNRKLARLSRGIDPQGLSEVPVPFGEDTILVAAELKRAVSSRDGIGGAGTAAGGLLETAAFASHGYDGFAGFVFGACRWRVTVRDRMSDVSFE